MDINKDVRQEEAFAPGFAEMEFSTIHLDAVSVFVMSSFAG